MGSCCVEQKPASNGAVKQQNGDNSAVHNNVKVGSMHLSPVYMRRNESRYVPV